MLAIIGVLALICIAFLRCLKVICSPSHYLLTCFGYGRWGFLMALSMWVRGVEQRLLLDAVLRPIVVDLLRRAIQLSLTTCLLTRLTLVLQ